MHALWRGTSHSESAPVHQLRGSLNLVPLGFMEDSFCSMTSLVTGDCTPPSGGLRLGLKVLTLQSHDWVPWQSSSTIGGLGPAQSLFCIITKTSVFMSLREAGTWDQEPFVPLLESLRLDQCLLGQQDVKKLEGAKSNCDLHNWGKQTHTIHKGQNPAASVAGRKKGVSWA